MRGALLLLAAATSAMPLATICPRLRHTAREEDLPVLRIRGGADGAAETKEKITSWWKQKQNNFGTFNGMAPGQGKTDPDRVQASGLMKRRGLANVEKACNLLRGALKRDPDNIEVKLELADALNTAIRIKTNANSLVIEGTQDCPAFKKVWATLGAEALPLATDVRKAMPNSVKALAVYADAFLYSSSSKGIIKQALTGVGKKFVAVGKELYKHPKWDSAVGCAFLGGFYNVAPWPVGSKAKAAKFLGEGATIAPTRRNLYYVGVNAYQTGDYKKAKTFFSRALKAPPCKDPSSTEDDIAEFILAEAKRGLKLSEEALAV